MPQTTGSRKSRVSRQSIAAYKAHVTMAKRRTSELLDFVLTHPRIPKRVKDDIAKYAAE